jgi:carbon monoxide dehydrogenase subunit G
VRVEGHKTLGVSRADAWRGVNDPEVLKTCAPGVTRLEETRPGHFEATLELKLPAIHGRFDGTVDIVERTEPDRLTLHIDLKGGPGFVNGEAELHLKEAEAGTALRYVADVQVGGQIARLGQRMISGVTKEMAGQFFESLDRVLSGGGTCGALSAPRNPIAAFFQLAWRTLLNLLGLSRRS